jgi:hypothetical protein
MVQYIKVLMLQFCKNIDGIIHLSVYVCMLAATYTRKASFGGSGL